MAGRGYRKARSAFDLPGVSLMVGRMGWLDAGHVAVTAGYCALLWVVQAVVYPQFGRVPAEAFKDYHAAHMRRISRVVIPLFAAEGAVALAVAALRWSGQPLLQGLSVGLYAAGALLTFLVFVPLHQRLQAGLRPGQLARLVRLNVLRAGLSSARLAVVLWISTAGAGG